MFGAQKVLCETGRAARGKAREATERNMMTWEYVRPWIGRSREQYGWEMVRGWVGDGVVEL